MRIGELVYDTAASDYSISKEALQASLYIGSPLLSYCYCVWESNHIIAPHEYIVSVWYSEAAPFIRWEGFSGSGKTAWPAFLTSWWDTPPLNVYMVRVWSSVCGHLLSCHGLGNGHASLGTGQEQIPSATDFCCDTVCFRDALVTWGPWLLYHLCFMCSYNRVKYCPSQRLNDFHVKSRKLLYCSSVGLHGLFLSSKCE